MEAIDVGVIGCGTAGGAAAILLSRAGHRVTVYERVPQPGPVGAGVMIQPTGLHVLERLGLADAVLARGSRVTQLFVENHRRRVVLDLDYAALAPHLFGTGLHRGVLFDSLYQLVKSSSLKLITGVAIVEVGEPDAGGRFVKDSDGNRHGPHQLVIVADGARSQLRAGAAAGQRIAEYPWGALFVIAPDPGSQHQARLHQMVRGTGHMLGVLPTGIGPDPDATTPLVSVFWSLRKDRLEAYRSAGLDAWKRDVLALRPSLATVLDGVTHLDQLAFATYLDVRMKRWHQPGVVWLGDAAHAMSPQLGQGVNLALVDAMVLADSLAAESDVANALATHTTLRKRHLGYYQLVTRWLTPFFQSDHSLLGTLRDVFMPIAGKIPFLRREMIRSMAGLKLGALRGSMPLPAPTTLRLTP